MTSQCWLFLVALLPAAAPLLGQTACRPPDYLSNMVEQQMSREFTQGGLPTVLANAGRPVSTITPHDIRHLMVERVCRRAHRVYAARVWKQRPALTGGVYVWRVGPFLAVMDPDHQDVPGSIERDVLLVDDRWETIALYGFEVVDYPW